MKRKALVIDDDEATLELMKHRLGSRDFSVVTATDGASGSRAAKEQGFDIILTDLDLPDTSGIELVREFKKISPTTEVIMITGYGSVSNVIDATRAGAFFYVEKPIDFDELFLLIEKAVERKQQAAEIRELRGKLGSISSYEGIIGGSRSMQNIFELIENVADSDANILILGESGTGKEVIANAVHFRSGRSDKPFVKVNCSALPKDLFESQLFGHLKGAFTGANKDKAGLIAKANGGSLLLDEISEMPADLQPKLLRVLQEKKYYRVGSDIPAEADFRLICATNRDPAEAIAEGLLREDLFYRINTIEIRIPPLRARTDDLPMLAEHFLEEYNEKYQREVKTISNLDYRQMLEHEWPGNVRELKHVVERAVLMAKGDSIESFDLPKTGLISASPGTNGVQGSAEVAGGANNSSPARTAAVVAEYETNGPEALFETLGNQIVNGVSLLEEGSLNEKDVFGHLETSVVRAALEKTNGNKRAAARLLGLYRARLYGMIKRHGLEEE